MGIKPKYDFNVDLVEPKKISWYYAPIFVAFWCLLYFSAVVLQIQHLPEALNSRDEHKYPTRFIAERADLLLENLTSFGPKVVGSVANEVMAVEFLKNEITKIQQQASDFFEFEVDVQEASGSYIHWSMLNMYQSIQNVVVKMSAKDSNSSNYLLINSHYDSAPSSPGAGDDASMVVIMLEAMRVLSKFPAPLKHPIVFLFNGAEENPLQASHAFITQHKWANSCKALINLDAAGSGGREILFQSGPQNPWLMKYYRLVPHPFATSLGEEMFQAGLIPSDTDFRIFRDYGGVPGLDMAYVFNGYFYHTEYDRKEFVSRESLQNTGDNILVLLKAIANAPEMDDPYNPSYTEGHVVFYDFIGWFLVFYTEDIGVVINVLVCIIAVVAIGASLFFMSVRSGLTWTAVLKRYGISFVIQTFSLAFAGSFTMLVALFLDLVNRSMSWYSESWLIIGLFYCPMFFGMAIFPSFYLEKTKKDPLSLGFRIQLFMHAHCLFLVILTIFLTIMNIRSSFMCMMAVLFDIAALIINLITRWHRKSYRFAVTATICQILPFVYYTSMAHVLYLVFIPMTGRQGSDVMPDEFMAGAAIFMTTLFAGVIMSIVLLFRKTRTIVSTFLVLTLLSIIMAVSPIGFPYRAKTSAQRLSLLHVQRTLHDADGNARLNEAGIYVYPQDRRIDSIDEYFKHLDKKLKISEYCGQEMFCAMPVYNHRWNNARNSSFWIPIDEFPILPGAKPTLILKSTTNLDKPNTKRFEFELQGPDHMTIFIDLKEKTNLTGWSFNDTMIREKWKKPYFIYFSYGKNSRALTFTVDVEKTNETFDTPSLEIGIAGHWVHQETQQTLKYQETIKSLPDHTTITEWVASYESWFF